MANVEMSRRCEAATSTVNTVEEKVFKYLMEVVISVERVEVELRSDTLHTRWYRLVFRMEKQEEDWNPDQEKKVLTAWNPALMHLEKLMDWVVKRSMLSITPSCRETRRWK